MPHGKDVTWFEQWVGNYGGAIAPAPTDEDQHSRHKFLCVVCKAAGRTTRPPDMTMETYLRVIPPILEALREQPGVPVYRITDLDDLVRRAALCEP
jgi:hypothetical protein